jgi:hypothetical protein
MKKEKNIQNVPFKPTFCFDFVTAVKINLVPSFLTFIVAPQIERKEEFSRLQQILLIVTVHQFGKKKKKKPSRQYKHVHMVDFRGGG